MKIALFNNMKGLIYGGDAKRISCDKHGVLTIGATEVKLAPESDAIMPLLFHGATGNYDATFTDTTGKVYTLEKITVQAGRLVAPSQVAAQIMELHCALDQANDDINRLREKIVELENIFDTDALNFLIR